MKTLVKLALLCLSAITLISCGAQRMVSTQISSNNSTFECVGLTDKGECMVSATGTGSDTSSISSVVLKNAIYALLFDGIKGNEENRVKDLPPMIADKNTFNTKTEYLTPFFSTNGKYLQFIKPMPGALPKTIRTKSGYKVTTTYLIDKNALRKELEANGIIKSLSNIL